MHVTPHVFENIFATKKSKILVRVLICITDCLREDQSVYKSLILIYLVIFFQIFPLILRLLSYLGLN